MSDAIYRKLDNKISIIDRVRKALPMKEFLEEHDPIARSTFNMLYRILEENVD